MFISFVWGCVSSCLLRSANGRQSDAKAGTFEGRQESHCREQRNYTFKLCKNDAPLFISRYAEDCWIMLPNAPALCGPNAANDFFQSGYNQFG